MDDVRSVLPQPIRKLPWSPHRWICEPDIDQVAVAADDRVDVLAACEGDEVVVLAVSCHRGLLDRVVDDHRVSPDALDELTNGPLVDVRDELRAPQHQFEPGEQPRAGDDADAVVHERSHHEVGCAAAAADERRDEDAWIDDDADHAAPRSRRELRSSSYAMRSASCSVSPADACVPSSSRPSRYAFKARSTTVASLARSRPS